MESLKHLGIPCHSCSQAGRTLTLQVSPSEQKHLLGHLALLTEILPLSLTLAHLLRLETFLICSNPLSDTWISSMTPLTRNHPVSAWMPQPRGAPLLLGQLAPPEDNSVPLRFLLIISCHLAEVPSQLLPPSHHISPWSAPTNHPEVICSSHKDKFVPYVGQGIISFF